MASDTPQYATVADHVRALEQAYGGTFDRRPNPNGSVTVRLVKRRGDVDDDDDEGIVESIAATGDTTALAVAALAVRVNAFLAALGGAT